MTTSAAGQPGGFGKLLRKYRRAAGLTQEELAERSGLSVRAVSDMERGRTSQPFPRSTRMLADALSLTSPTREEFLSAADATDGFVQWAVPRQLPVDVNRFSSRMIELAELDKLTDSVNGVDRAMIVVISGTAGVGKTTLAVHWAHHAADRFPDGQLYVNLHGFGPSRTPLAPAVAIHRFLTAFGVPARQIPSGLEVQAALYRSILAGKRVLVLLDNARDAEQVRPLLPGSAACQVIVTSRDPLLALAATGAAGQLTLDLLSSGEARELLASRLGGRNPAGEGDALAVLVDQCARLPLALSVVAARAAAHPEFSLASLVTELQDAADRLGVLDAWDPESSVRAVFSWSYQHLTDRAARMFRLLSVHPGPDITAAAAASLAAVPRVQARQLLGELTRAQLLDERAPGRFAFHDLLRAYAAERLHEVEGNAGCRVALRRILDHYLHTAQAAELLLQPSREPVTLVPPPPGVQIEDLSGRARAMTWYQAEYCVLRTVIDHAADAGEDVYVWQLPRTMEVYSVREGRWHDLAAILGGALDAAGRLGDPAAQAHSYRGLGRVHALLGSPAQARDQLAAALGLFRQLGDRTNLALTHTHISGALSLEGRFSEALEQASRALELHRGTGNRLGLAGALNNVSWYQTCLGQYEPALARCHEALTIFRDIGDDDGAAQSLDTLGAAHCGLGDYPRAIHCYQQSHRLFRETGNLIDQAETLAHLAEAQHATGDLHAAHDTWQQALTILDELPRDDARYAAGQRSLQFTTVEPGPSASLRVIVRGSAGYPHQHLGPMLDHGRLV